MKWMLVLVLAGCGSAPLAPQRVEVPVFTPCVKVAPRRPAYEFDQLTPVVKDGEIVLALVRDWLRGRKYEGELEAIIEGCLSIASPPSVHVLDLPPRSVPMASKEALQPIPPAG
ncbi:hypothetical protein [Janthinobacterium sp. SUN033]|uniref:hypothetical protein n=1 Tax=Janthinobacterium sp. SUN033 TaxID=3002439 RepID=UPI0025B14112|nr:hypothetical protein [Janthinobacterium sp. SUN033]MDN2676691.1 hypothetical protein [Janthinobacterium sp. SUN033]